MSMKRYYKCNICRDEIKALNDCFGIVFQGTETFSLCDYRSADDVHICFKCARQLKLLLNNAEITRLLEEGEV